MSDKWVMDSIRKLARPLRKEETLAGLLNEAGNAKYVLLGEASHGTSEYYSVRTELSKRLIAEQGFRFIAVEGDWPSCYTLNRYIKGYTGPGAALSDFNRWPSWMWANQEIRDLAEWLRDFNKDKPDADKAGFYGMDVYSLWESMDEILKYLAARGSVDLEAAERAFECFEPYTRDEQSYGVSASLYGEGCEEEVIALLSKLQGQWKSANQDDQEEALSAELNAMAVKGAEAYYRTMIRHDSESWNIRDRHMVSALEKLMEFYGEKTRALVWAHNTHIGDARATDMAQDEMINVGQLLREKHGSDVYAIGFGSYQGTVTAGRSWGAVPETMNVPPAITNSWEELLHRDGAEDKLLMFHNEERTVLDEVMVGHRAIGVVYHPERERGNYVPTVISKRYDAFIYLDQTKALVPLRVEAGQV
ncbi:hypothetical protein GCM10010912_33670 [Paenibacillus albidus]|uniref:Erythromycin esterase family protein n=1 Tax=Paenibacillus albidus TaxID=2041023 RepID=A0A917CED2_9BACL|nr:erythromycin esterase family protein [Paenibacillus albidus]GGF85636.1 hypothetical protein GCM10010912_33670 [Paenibacillus albidus]